MDSLRIKVFNLFNVLPIVVLQDGKDSIMLRFLYKWEQRACPHACIDIDIIWVKIMAMLVILYNGLRRVLHKQGIIWIDVVLCMEDKCAHIALRERVREDLVIVFYRYASDVE